MNYPLLHWDILELLVKQHSRENSLGETCKRLYRIRPTKKKDVIAFTMSLTSVKWLISSNCLSSRQVSIIAVRQGNIPLLKQMRDDGCLVIDADVLRVNYNCYDWESHNTPTRWWLYRQVIKAGFDDWPGYTTDEQDELDDRWEWFLHDEWFAYEIEYALEDERKYEPGDEFNEDEYEEIMQYEDDLLAHQIYHDYHVINDGKEIHVLSVHDD